VWLSACASAGRTRIEVSDEGPGIAPHEAERVFERFYRADVARNGAGSGLGLAIARWIVDAHGGAIRAEARVDDDPAGTGCRMVVELPA
jgi:signal transduction histidine kinase